MNISMRQATLDDAPLISAMAQRIWRNHYVPIVGAAQVEYMLQKMYSTEALTAQMNDGQLFYIPEDAGDPLGYLAISQKSPGQYFLHKYYIDNGKRGLGLGKIILERLLEQYPDMQELRLTVNRQNYKSINFYFRVGFTIEFCLDTPIGEGYSMDDFQMVLQLSPRKA